MDGTFIPNRRGTFAASAVALFLVCSQAPGQAGAPAAVPNDERAIAHALNRLAFGARPGDVERVARIGLGTWIEQQLRPERIPDTALAPRLDRLTTIGLDSREIAQNYIMPARQARRAQQRQQQPAPAAPGAQPEMLPRGPVASETMQRQRQVFTDLAEAKLLRAVYSERQLEEVLVDFWFNHFNVFARKGQTEIYVGEYERDAIRPHVLGTFRELLGATAKSPAMLFYLDNWLSADPNASPARRGADRLMRPRGQRRPNQATPQPPPQQAQRQARGLNENYARELLELHTLGVDGGYTQKDVVEVARAFTGWTIGAPAQPGFRFAAALHDRGEKRMLGQTIPAGGGIEDGERVLDLLAGHPSTARHVAFKLAQRLVSDTPPPALVDRAAERFRATKGDLREVVRTIVTSAEFFAPDASRAKVKTPFEFVVSALRATSADVSTALPIVRALQTLGMPLYLCQPPTGYDDTADAWVSSGALVNRMNFALDLASGTLRGVRSPLTRSTNLAALRTQLTREVLGGTVSAATEQTIAKATTVEQTIALAIGSPEFQRQ